MWEARAEYADGTTINRLFAYDERKTKMNSSMRLNAGYWNGIKIVHGTV